MIIAIGKPHAFIAGKLNNWIQCYLLSELLGVGGSLLCVSLAVRADAHLMVVAISGVAGELFGFYLPLAIREFAAQRCESPLLSALRLTGHHLLIKFGLAELFDTILSRPLLMAGAMYLFESAFTGLLVGGTLADLFFYGMVGISTKVRINVLKIKNS